MPALKLLCPTCHKRLDVPWVCANGHRFLLENGVLELLDETFGKKLRNFLEPFSQLREQEARRIDNKEIFPNLPGVFAHYPEWRQRTYDLVIIRRLLAGKSNRGVLDIGAWNGWLSHRLAEMGHIVTAVDYFADPHDGLGARLFYPTNWDAVQMNLEDLSSLDQLFDVIILNRCVQFFCDPSGYAAMAHKKLAPGGMMILTGLAFFRDPRNKIQGVQDLRAHMNTNGFDFFKEIKGYLDFNDKRQMQKMDIRLHTYPQLRIPNLKSLLSPLAPQHFYGVWR